jgi:hypothetical protein
LKIRRKRGAGAQCFDERTAEHDSGFFSYAVLRAENDTRT